MGIYCPTGRKWRWGQTNWRFQ